MAVWQGLLPCPQKLQCRSSSDYTFSRQALRFGFSLACWGGAQDISPAAQLKRHHHEN